MQVSPIEIWESGAAAQFAEALVGVRDVQGMQNFLRDVMTEKEIIEISSRLEAAKMLQQGAKYAEIIDKTKLSSRTVARISEWLREGSGGYAEVLKTLSAHQDHIPPVRAE